MYKILSILDYLYNSMNAYRIQDVDAAAFAPLIQLMEEDGYHTVLFEIYKHLINGKIDEIHNNIPQQLSHFGVTHQHQFKEAFLRDLIDYFAERISV